MTEEQITKAIAIWLEANQWEIIAIDFPQSGTGRRLKNNNDDMVIIPDIIAYKNSVMIFMENKDRFNTPDLTKVKNYNKFSNNIDKLLLQYNCTNYFVGIGCPLLTAKQFQKILKSADFILYIVETNKIINHKSNVKNLFK